MTRADLDTLKQSIDRALESHLPAQSKIAQNLLDAMRYAVLGGGKRLRPLLTCATATGLGTPLSSALPAACAVEFVHTYSLVHDDLPAMDDDALRHGRAATHIAHGEATAILAGDALLTLAFEVLSDLPKVGGLCCSVLARAAGWRGMVGGQDLDMRLPSAENAADQQTLEALHGAKTGALIGASVEIGATIAEADDEVCSALRRFSTLIGLAFQVRDDVLDVTATSEALGKPAGSDLAEGKQTFVTLMGVDAASAYASRLLSEAHATLEPLRLVHDGLNQLADRAVQRSF